MAESEKYPEQAKTPTNQNAADPHALLEEQMTGLKSALLGHPVYKMVQTPSALRIFMESHVFAVWDFMTLLKTLQRELTCVTTPWTPPTNTGAARLINEIVLCEETDEISPGLYVSHFDLYLAAMEEVDADVRPIRAFVRSISSGLTPKQALQPLPIPESTKAFVLTTLSHAAGTSHEVAAAFLMGREAIIPSMFEQILTKQDSWEDFTCNWFVNYLERHNELDGEEHGPMATELLRNLCGDDPQNWRDALQISREAVEARVQLWNGVAEAILTEGERPPLRVVRSKRLKNPDSL